MKREYTLCLEREVIFFICVVWYDTHLILILCERRFFPDNASGEVNVALWQR